MSRGETLAYLAGVIDSDGTIGVRRHTYAGTPTYSERICVRQVTHEAVDLLHETFGGHCYLGKPYSKNGKSLYGWEVTDLKATKTIHALLPYLRIKKKQAENCLRLRQLKERSKKERVAVGRGHVGCSPRSQELSDAMEETHQAAKMLNKVGR